MVTLKNIYINTLKLLGSISDFIYPYNKKKIFIFHEISKKNQKKFYKVIKYIKSKYEILDPNNDFKFKNNRKNQAFITFDDGYFSQYECAKKYLDKENIKAIFFIIYEFMKIKNKKNHKEFLKKNLLINKIKLNNKEFKNMTFENLKVLIKKGHIIGAHTLNHPNLTQIDKNNCKKEILSCKKKIKTKIGVKKIGNFAITFGGIKFINPYILKLCKKYYKATFTGIRGSNNNNKQIFFRENCDLNKDFSEIKFTIDGYADLHYFFDRLRLKVYKYFSTKC